MSGRERHAPQEDRAMRSAEVFHPSEYLRDEMHARGWSRQDVATRSGLNIRVIDEILDHGRPVNRIVAIGLSTAFGTSSELWENLQAKFDKALFEALGGDA